MTDGEQRSPIISNWMKTFELLKLATMRIRMVFEHDGYLSSIEEPHILTEFRAVVWPSLRVAYDQMKFQVEDARAAVDNLQQANVSCLCGTVDDI